jgi:NIMA-interacting peptidyl-prolyl cis-trans isomerase 1
MGFKPPEWASQPCREATLEVHRGSSVDRTPVDAQPWYIIGRCARAGGRHGHQ